MRLVTLASLLTAGLIALAMGVAPTPSQADNHTTSCTTCGKGHAKRGGHQWEYKCVHPRKKPDAMSAQFTAMGAEGWRLQDADGGIWCFARMKPRL